MNAPLQASLIICSRNRATLLGETLQSILAGDDMPDEILIIDQSNQQNPTLAALRQHRGCDIRYFHTSSVGLSRANNLGIAESRYDVLIFTHDDVLVPADWFRNLWGPLLVAGPRTVVTGRVLPGAEQIPDGFAPATRTDPMPAEYAGRIGHDVLYPFNMAMYRSVTTEIGPFDVRLGPGTPFPGGEDNDFGFRLLEAGYRIQYVPEAMLYHRAWRPPQAYVPLRWNYGLARGGFYAKHLSLRDRYMLRRMWRDIVNHLLAIPGDLRSDRRRACGNVFLVVGILSGCLRWLVTYRRPSVRRD